MWRRWEGASGLLGKIRLGRSTWSPGINWVPSCPRLGPYYRAMITSEAIDGEMVNDPSVLLVLEQVKDIWKVLPLPLIDLI